MKESHYFPTATNKPFIITTLSRPSLFALDLQRTFPSPFHKFLILSAGLLVRGMGSPLISPLSLTEQESWLGHGI